MCPSLNRRGLAVIENRSFFPTGFNPIANRKHIGLISCLQAKVVPAALFDEDAAAGYIVHHALLGIFAKQCPIEYYRGFGLLDHAGHTKASSPNCF
jgi:hypothetical protein